MTNAMAMIDRPNAMAMPSVPSVAPATAALPQPNSVSTNVPNASAAYFFIGVTSMLKAPLALNECLRLARAKRERAG